MEKKQDKRGRIQEGGALQRNGHHLHSGPSDPAGVGAPAMGKPRDPQAKAGGGGTDQNAKSGFVCDICGRAMLIREAHYEIEGSDFPVCYDCWLSDAIRKGAGHE